MVNTWSLAAALVGVCATAASWRTAEGVKACADCTGTTCILEDTATKLNAGDSKLALKLCNYDASKTYALEFSLKAPLACDTKSALVPKLKSLTANGACNGAECPVTATLEDPIDWAVVMRSGADVNAVLATFKSGGKAEAVTVAIGQDIGGAAIETTTTSNISVCSKDVTVTALRLSQVDGCNTADICRGKASDTVCSIAVKQGLPISSVNCTDGTCSGKVSLSGALACDASSGDTNSLIVAVKVGNSAMSNYRSVGTLTAPTSAITDISDLDAGEAQFTLSTDSFCPTTAVEVTVSKEDGTSAASVTSVNTTNDSMVVTLSSPLDSALDGTKLQFTLTQCSVKSEAFVSVVGDDGSGSGSDGSIDDSDAGGGGDGGGRSSTGTGNKTTQETNLSTGLGGGMIVGVAVGVVAFIGFVFECWYHKRRQRPSQPQSNNDAPTTSSFGQNVI